MVIYLILEKNSMHFLVYRYLLSYSRYCWDSDRSIEYSFLWKAESLLNFQDSPIKGNELLCLFLWSFEILFIYKFNLLQ